MRFLSRPDSYRDFPRPQVNMTRIEILHRSRFDLWEHDIGRSFSLLLPSERVCHSERK